MNTASLRSSRVLFVACLVLVGCGTPTFSVPDARDDGGADGASALDASDVARVDASDRATIDAPPSDVPLDAPISSDAADVTDVANTDAVDVRAGCHGDVDCAAGRVCCLATGACYDPSCLACCMPVVDGGPGTDGSIGACTSNAECGVREYCAGTGCGTSGSCATMPLGCPRILDPVCGCDGVDYDNECLANSAGVRMSYRGACGGAMDAGGPGGCLSNAECGAREYCDGLGCGTPGMCSPRPDLCSTLYSPVCGCDGATYSNACMANAVGVRVGTDGPCGGTIVDAGAGGCTDNSMCARGEYCAGTSCDGDGTCRTRPEACLDVYNPVCGCDGRTYSNACYANAAGVRVASTGECAGIDRCATVRCAAGEACCPSTGACYDTRCLACCRSGI